MFEIMRKDTVEQPCFGRCVHYQKIGSYNFGIMTNGISSSTEYALGFDLDVTSKIFGQFVDYFEYS